MKRVNAKVESLSTEVTVEEVTAEEVTVEHRPDELADNVVPTGERRHTISESQEQSTRQVSSQVKNTYLTEMRGDAEEGTYLRLIDFCITQV